MMTLGQAARGLAAALLLAAGGGLTAGTPGSAWFQGGRPSPQAHEAVALLAGAATHGLDPADYRASALRQAIADASGGTAPDAAAAQRLGAALERALQRYLEDLHRGRIDPRTLGQGYRLPPRADFDAAARLDSALAAQSLDVAVREAAPQLPQYERLRDALAAYRALGDHAAWHERLPPLPTGARGASDARLAPGQPYAGLGLLAQRLAALGDLQPQGGGPHTVYDSSLVEAVRSFQRRHGLVDDGVVGAATLARLDVAPATRVRQIELALERLRWTPLLQGQRMIVVNIPEFVLRAYEVQGGRVFVREQMKVIVGKALDTRTPLFDAELRFVEFSPYWNVPPSIARNEIVPRLRRDPGYFEREGFEFVDPGGRVDATLTASHIDALRAGKLRIRQRPGERNALGGVKFVFPNEAHIFLHHTPAVALFERDRRDFSHGCIRVERPVDLARFVLHDMPGWTAERIAQAMQGDNAVVRVASPPRVLIAYGTVLVKQGRVHFFDDLYGQDRRLDAALRQNALQRQQPD